MAKGEFSKIFQDELDEIERRALKAGTNLTAICRQLGISRSTPDRWRRNDPKTIRIIDQMREFVAKAERKKAATETVSAG
jgi:transposase-like protein